MGLHVVMLGPPGAGKGTQGGRLARERGLVRVSTGDMLRDAIRQGTPTGVQVQETMARGELVVDDTMIALVRERLLQADAKAGFLLDGFPRTVPQAEALDGIREEVGGGGPLVVIDVQVPFAELVRRLSGRRICGVCGATADPFGPLTRSCGECGGTLVQRNDDDREVVTERLRVYERQTFPLVEYYRRRPTFRKVNGAQSPSDVAHEIDTVVDEAMAVSAVAQKSVQA